MEFCENCGAKVMPNAKYCTKCGTAVPGLRICPCGQVLTEEEKYCPQCGNSTDGTIAHAQRYIIHENHHYKDTDVIANILNQYIKAHNGDVTYEQAHKLFFPTLYAAGEEFSAHHLFSKSPNTIQFKDQEIHLRKEWDQDEIDEFLQIAKELGYDYHSE